jgi:protein gp37
VSAKTGISWADSTYNHWIGCTKVGPGCDHCYAETMDKRKVFQGTVHWGQGVPRMLTSKSNRKKPLLWNKELFFECPDCGLRGNAQAMGDDPKVCIHPNAYITRRRVFCSSLADVFDNEVDPQWRHDLFALIQATPHLDWLLLTKRIGNVEKLVDKTVFEECRNIWLGATVVNQEEADRDIPKLLSVPAAVRFLSMEPLLGNVDLTTLGTGLITMNALVTVQSNFDGIPQGKSQIDWVIVGGESGTDARPMHPDWARSLRDQCKAAGVPFLFKQWGEFVHESSIIDDGSPFSDSYKRNAQIHICERAELLYRVGKSRANDLLDGVEHKAFPRSA